ncbi:F-box/LRR-repeat protein 2 [Galdieria sulphuraria]|nr:F-box/LRR-repeat protein 2 [Galdieria sulphuraria]
MAHTLSSEVPIINNSTKTICIIDEEDYRRMTHLAAELRKARGNIFSELSSNEKGIEMVLRSGRKLGSCSTNKVGCRSKRACLKRKRADDWNLHRCSGNCIASCGKFVKQGSFCGFNTLPKDLLFHICSFLTDFLDIVRLRRTCRSFREIFSSNLLFPKLDFGNCRYLDDNMLLSFLSSSFLPFKASILRLFECTLEDTTEHLDIRWCTELDESITEKLSKLLKLKTLLMSHTRRISAVYLPSIFESLHSLRVVDLSFTSCNREVLFQLNYILSQRLQMIEKLDLSWCPNVGSRSLFSIASRCNMLQEIGLSETKVSDDGLCELMRSCPRINSIQASRCSRIRDSFVQFIVDNIVLRERLTSLDISSCHNISDTVVEELLKQCRNLRFVDVSNDGEHSILYGELEVSLSDPFIGCFLVPGFEFPLLITTTNNLGAFVWSFLFIRFVVNNIPHCSKERLLYSFFPVSGSAPLFVMFWGLLLGTEVFKLNLFFSIGLICLGLALTSVGNYAGNTLGIILQLTAVAAGGFRWCLMQILLQRRGDEHRVSALELTYYTAPLTALVLFPFVVGLEGKSFVAYLTNTASSQVAYMILILLLISTFVFLLLIVEYLLYLKKGQLLLEVQYGFMIV